MIDTPWQGDACGLVEAYHRGERTPSQEMEAVLSAIEMSELNCFSFVEDDHARRAAASAEVSQPLGGVPFGVKELDKVEGWPDTEASLVFRDRRATYTSTAIARADAAGVARVGLTTASEYGGLNVSITRLNGITGNPWNPTRTAGGSSGGSAAAVAGGLVPLASGGDGGGSIRIPAAFCGLVGMKGTAGRIPRSPRTAIAPLTVVMGCLARSVRDVARYYDAVAGYDMRDPYSLETVEGWERDLGTHDLSGMRAVIAPTLGSAIVHDGVAARVTDAGEALASATGLKLVDAAVDLPGLGFEWVMSNMAGLRNEIGDAWPDCQDDMTIEMAFGLKLAEQQFNLDMAATVERERTAANEAMAAVFDEVDFIICATNPDVACPAEVTLNTRVGDQTVDATNNGALTIPANIVGNPAISIPVEPMDGLPVGMQIIGRHRADALLLDLAAAVQNDRPWPLVVPDAPL